MAQATIHLVGGGAVEVILEADGLTEVAERLRRDRVLIGRIAPESGEEPSGCEVLIRGYRVQLIRWG